MDQLPSAGTNFGFWDLDVRGKPSSRSHSVLIIEDEPVLRVLLRDLLCGDGYQVLEAEDGRQGMRLFNQVRPDIVLLDILMPEMDGIETVQDIRRIDPAAVVFIMTGGTLSEVTSKTALLLGANRAFLKPLDTNELLGAIRNVLAPGSSGS